MITKTYGKTSSQAIAKEQKLSPEKEKAENYRTTNQREFGEENFRRMHDNTENKRITEKDQDEYNEYFTYFGIDQTELYKQETEPRAIDELPTVGYSGFKSKYRNNLMANQGANNSAMNFNVGPLVAKLKKNIYTDVSELDEYKTLPNGFQKTMKDNQ